MVVSYPYGGRNRGTCPQSTTNEEYEVYTVSVHEIDRCYGGAEEGGWWYDCGVPARQHAGYTRVFSSRTKAIRYMQRMNRETVPTLREGREYWSAAYAGGDFRAVLQEGTNARPFPQQFPRYE